MDNPLIIKMMKQTLMKAGYPERVWEPSGRSKDGTRLWYSRPATNKDWSRRWEVYVKLRRNIRNRARRNQYDT